MIATITDYSRAVDEDAILGYHFDEELKRTLSDRVIFEDEDSNFAPEPSIACRLRNESGVEFTLLFLQSSKQLLVFAEAGVDRAITAREFVAEFPELQSYRLGGRAEPNDSSGAKT